MTRTGTPLHVDVQDASHAGDARRRAMRIAADGGLDENRVATVGIIVTELVTNLVRHARDGWLYAQWTASGDGPALEIVSYDAGPGMDDVARCFGDGYSTLDSQGTGLGAVRRLSSEFDVYSRPGQGTVILSRVHATAPRRRTRDAHALSWSVMGIPAPGEAVSGDNWRVQSDGNIAHLMVTDGLGHGEQAAEAAEAAVELFDREAARGPAAVSAGSAQRAARHARRRGSRCACRRGERTIDVRRHRQHRGHTDRWRRQQGTGVAQRHHRRRDPQEPGVRLPVAGGCADGDVLRRRAQPLVAGHLSGSLSAAPGAHCGDAVARLPPWTGRRDGAGRAARGQGRMNGERELPPELAALHAECLALRAQVGEQEELIATLNVELQETNNGVVALYAELDDRAEQLRQASDLKSRFLSYMSHEFKTPLGSITSLTRILLDRMDGPLTDEQVRQVMFVRDSAAELNDMVNDLLDLAKVEAGRITISPAWFEMVDLLSALRGMFKPIINTASVDLIFEQPEPIPPLYTDHKKLSQILRNFVSNAIKFTATARCGCRPWSKAGGTFSVTDTGIGIERSSSGVLFRFRANRHAHPKTPARNRAGIVAGKKLAELLGGNVAVTSEEGRGSRFSVVIPIRYTANK